MKNLLKRFYFFSKLSTSLILLILLVFMCYLFVKTYLDQNKIKSDNQINNIFNDQLDDLSNTVKQNSDNLNTIKNLVLNNKKSVRDISDNIKNFKNNTINKDVLIQINKLSERNKKLENELYKLTSIINKLEYSDVSKDKNIKKPILLNNVISLIRVKLDDGSNFSSELDILKNLKLESKYIPYLEKLDIHAIKKFSGIDNLIIEFDEISSIYLNEYFLKKYDNHFIKYFLKLVKLQPNINDDIQDQNILFLSLAKQNLLQKNIKESIKNINKLKNSKYFFSIWIKNANYYEDVNYLLNNIEQ